MHTKFMAEAGRLAARGFGARGAGRAAAVALLRVALFAVAVSWSASALAQNGTGGTSGTGGVRLDVPNIKRQDPTHPGDYDYRDSRKWWISYQDCLDNENFTFPLTLTDTTRPLEVWVGSDDCAAKRGLDDHGQCWLVQNIPSPDDTQTIPVPVRNVVNHGLDEDAVPMDLPDEVCKGSTDLNGEAVTFYFMLVDGGKSVGSQSWTPTNVGGTGYDLVGPYPPGEISVGIGDSQLSVRLDNLPADTQRDSFQAFCAPSEPKGDAGAEFIPDGTDAGTVPPGGDTGAAAPDACYTSGIIAGAPPDDTFYCGKAPTTAKVLNTIELVNDRTYAVGVVALDDIGNRGNVSTIACGTPIPLDDFFELYSRNGGPGGGGGLCTMTPGPSRYFAAPVLLCGLALLALGARRRRGQT